MATITKYNSFLKNQMDGTAVIDFNTDDVNVMLVTSSYTPDAANHVYKSSVTNEVSGSNYTARGETITTPTLTESSGTVTFDGDDVTWAQHASGFANARYAIVYKDTGVDGTSPLIGYIDLVADKGNVSGPLTIQWSASGILTWA